MGQVVKNATRGEKRARQASVAHIVKRRRQKSARRDKNNIQVDVDEEDGHMMGEEVGVGEGEPDAGLGENRLDEAEEEADDDDDDDDDDGENHSSGSRSLELGCGARNEASDDGSEYNSGTAFCDRLDEIEKLSSDNERSLRNGEIETGFDHGESRRDIVEFIMDLNDDEARNTAERAGLAVGREEEIRSDTEAAPEQAYIPTHLSFEIGELEVEEVSRRQRKIVRERVSSSRKLPKSRKRKNAVTSKQLESSDRKDGAIERCWMGDMKNLRRLQPDFFSSREATLKKTTRTTKGVAAYHAIPMNQFNNADLQSIFIVEYERKTKFGGSYSSFCQLTTVAGQFMRLRVVRRLSFLNVLHKCGEVFRAICDRESIDLFLDHYDVRTESTTVMVKALHMKKIAEHAVLYFSDRDPHLHAEAQRSKIKLQKIFNVQKMLGRRAAAQKKRMTERISDARVFFPGDFKRGRESAKRHLEGIIGTYRQMRKDKGAKSALEKVSQSGVMRKWFINILLLLIFSAGGQRPQVYAQMQAPTLPELSEMKESGRKNDFFQLRTGVEKTQRSLDMPHVIVPGFVLRYVLFHSRIMRKIAVERTGVEEQVGDDMPLIMHTETGEALSTPQVTKTLRGYLQHAMPEATNVTMMSLRSSYCTMVMQDYRQKKIFTSLNEQEFLEVLSKNLNTSPEQLRTTYIGIDDADFAETAKELVKVVGHAELWEDNESDGGF